MSEWVKERQGFGSADVCVVAGGSMGDRAVEHEESIPRGRCFYLLRYASRNYCKLSWYQGNVFEPPIEATCVECENWTQQGPLVKDKDHGQEE